MEDRRKSQRILTNQKCWCEGKDITLYIRITNLSEGGAFIRSSILLNKGDKVKISLELPTGEEVVVVAEVKWVAEDRKTPQFKEPGMGLQFLSFEKGKEAFINFIRDSIKNQN